MVVSLLTPAYEPQLVAAPPACGRRRERSGGRRERPKRADPELQPYVVEALKALGGITVSRSRGISPGHWCSAAHPGEFPQTARSGPQRPEPASGQVSFRALLAGAAPELLVGPPRQCPRVSAARRSARPRLGEPQPARTREGPRPPGGTLHYSGRTPSTPPGEQGTDPSCDQFSSAARRAVGRQLEQT